MELKRVLMSASKKPFLEPDISISGDFSISAFTLDDLVKTKLTVEWSDASNLRAGSVRLTDTTSSSRILNFLNTHLDDVVAGIKTIAGSIEQATEVDLLDKKLPLIDKTLGESTGFEWFHADY